MGLNTMAMALQRGESGQSGTCDDEKVGGAYPGA